MNTKRKLGMLVLLFVAGAGLTAACGPVSGASCEFDTDCPTNELCYEGVCEPTCESQEDCFADETCVPRAGATGSVCLLTQTGDANNTTPTPGNNDPANNMTPVDNNNTAQCTTNEECAELGEDFFCNAESQCEEIAGPASVYQVVQILDTSHEDGVRDACTPRDPGSDLMYSYVQAADGTILGWADLIDFADGEADHADGNTHTGALATLFDGNPPGYFSPANECPAQFSGNVVALGCGGHMLVRYLDDEGRPVNLANDHQIVVGEWGSPSCGSTDTNDFYQVRLCTNTEQASQMDTSSCTELLGEFNSGINTADVTLP